MRARGSAWRSPQRHWGFSSVDTMDLLETLVDASLVLSALAISIGATPQ
jgi:hypothetical protein